MLRCDVLCCVAVLCCAAALCWAVHGVHFWQARPSRSWPHPPVGCRSQIDRCLQRACVEPQVSGRPIKFVGTGEKMEALEPFYPERMASRILGGCSPRPLPCTLCGRFASSPLVNPTHPAHTRAPPLECTGMGDVVTLVEKAEDAIQAEEAAELTKKMMTGACFAMLLLVEGMLAGGMVQLRLAGEWCGMMQAGEAAKVELVTLDDAGSALLAVVVLQLCCCGISVAGRPAGEAAAHCACMGMGCLTCAACSTLRHRPCTASAVRPCAREHCPSTLQPSSTSTTF